MSQTKQTQAAETAPHQRISDLRASPMMAHLLDALEEGTDIGHYGRLVFVMVGRHFMEDDDMIRVLSNQPEWDETKARALVMQVKDRNYSPPKRDRILQWQAQQEFPICPTPDDPASCNVYRELKFPDGIYEHIQDFWEERAEGQ
jgi:hypothetical protein